MKWSNQKEIPTQLTGGWGKTKMTLRYLLHLGTYIKKTYSKPSEQLFPNTRPLSYLNGLKYENIHKAQITQIFDRKTQTIRTTTEVSPCNDQ